MNYRDHRITCDRSTYHGINESDGRSGYQLVSELSDCRNEIFGIKSGMDPWNFRIVFRNVSVRDSDHCSWRSPWDDLYDRCNDELSEYEERHDAYVVLITILVATFISYFVLKEFVLSSLINNGGSTTNFLNNIL